MAGFDAALAQDTDGTRCSGSLNGHSSVEKEDGVCEEEVDSDAGDLSVESEWERLKKDKTQQDIKEKCNCENDPKVLKEDGETTYFYRLMICRSECKI